MRGKLPCQKPVLDCFLLLWLAGEGWSVYGHGFSTLPSCIDSTRDTTMYIQWPLTTVC